MCGQNLDSIPSNLEFFANPKCRLQEIYVQKRAVANGRYYASPVAANGNIYVVSLDDGAFTVLKAGTPAPEVVAENPKLDEKTSATPAIVGDTIYVRTSNDLWAFAEKP